MTERMKILIGYDESDCAEAALDDLKRAGLPANAEAQILTVAEVWLPPPPPSSYEIVEQAREVKVPADLKRVYAKGCAAAKEALSSAKRARERVKINFPDWDVSADSACGSPAWELVFKADQWKPDLIVVGSHGRTALARFVLGSVSQRVLTEARCSVRVARGRVEESDSPVRIIIGVDGSPGSEAAVHAAAARAWPPNSEVKLVVVDDPLIPAYVGELIPPLAKTIEEDIKEDRAWAERIAARSATLLHGAEIKVTRVLRQGDPKHELPKAAEEWGADCIFVGSAGFSNRFERFVLGSVSAAVAARAHCSVEVVRQNSQVERTE
ncbi:MAG: universal stress protein [Pyrinomonadaceae bacterium]|nr:universal stress protein [Pyrinomonadaceae bacterium]